MIDSKELRIGNSIQGNNLRGEFFMVDGLADGRIRTTSDGMHWYHPSMFDPIPLTEEILLKCGFEKIIDDKFTMRLDYKKDRRLDWLINKQNQRLSGIRFAGLVLYDEVKYLHQLQNLVYVLYGKELEVKL